MAIGTTTTQKTLHRNTVHPDPKTPTAMPTLWVVDLTHDLGEAGFLVGGVGGPEGPTNPEYSVTGGGEGSQGSHRASWFGGQGGHWICVTSAASLSHPEGLTYQGPEP